MHIEDARAFIEPVMQLCDAVLVTGGEWDKHGHRHEAFRAGYIAC